MVSGIGGAGKTVKKKRLAAYDVDEDNDDEKEEE